MKLFNRFGDKMRGRFNRLLKRYGESTRQRVPEQQKKSVGTKTSKTPAKRRPKATTPKATTTKTTS